MNVVFVLLWMYVAWQIANERDARSRRRAHEARGVEYVGATRASVLAQS
jgi:hypothetical protein